MQKVLHDEENFLQPVRFLHPMLKQFFSIKNITFAILLQNFEEASKFFASWGKISA